MFLYENKYEEFLFHKIDESDLLSGFLIGHLVIEHLLEEIITSYDPKLKSHFMSLSHSRKIALINSLELIPDGVAVALQSINKMRNKFAHELGYEPNKGELKNLVLKCKDNFNDLSDGLEQLLGALEDRDNFQETYEKYGCGLTDLFIQVVYDLESYAQKSFS
ncbi:hypothetical protein QNZ94_003977 [Vibrio parahaemolyticus]|nr:hypothetical protein [Vibrio parahaemolyticus]